MQPPDQAAHSTDGLAPFFSAGLIRAPRRPGCVGAIDRWDLLRLLGSGGMGAVFLARDSSDPAGAAVALKIMQPGLAAVPQAVHRFITEARHTAALQHPRILRVLHAAAEPAPFYITPYLRRGSLQHALKPGVPMPWRDALAILADVSDALDYAHGRGIIHRDLKPANILMDDDGRPLLCDFGLVRTVFNDSIVDVGRTVPEGTAPYMSPAVAHGQAEDTRCDIYALGAMGYELLAGHPPYRGQTSADTVRQIIAGPPPPLAKLDPQLPAPVVQVVQTAMARELRNRYATMADFRADLLAVLDGKPPAGVGGASAGRHGRWLIPAAAALLLALIVGAWRALSTHPDEPTPTPRVIARSSPQAQPQPRPSPSTRPTPPGSVGPAPSATSTPAIRNPLASAAPARQITLPAFPGPIINGGDPNALQKLPPGAIRMAKMEGFPPAPVLHLGDRGRKLYVGAATGIFLLDPDTLTLSPTTWGKDVDAGSGLFVSPGGDLALTLSVAEPRQLTLWDTATGQPLHRITPDRTGSLGIFLNPDGQTATILRFGKNEFIDFRTGRSWRGPGHPIQAGAVTPDGKHELIADERGVQLRRLADGFVVWTDGGCHLPTVRLDAAGTRGVVASVGAVKVYDLMSGRVLLAVTGSKGSPKCAISADGHRLAVAGARTVVCFDIDAGTILCEYQHEIPHNQLGYTQSVWLLGDGDRVLTIYAGIAVVWQVPRPPGR